MYQEKYWKDMYQLKVHLNYIELYLERSEYIERCLNVFLAITSSSSICGWAIWNEYAYIWAVIIAASQLITAIKSFLPYKARIKSLSGLLHEYEELLISFEAKWFDVSEGNLTKEEINKAQFDFRKLKAKALSKHLAGRTLPEKGELFKKAQSEADKYFKLFYNAA